MSTDPYPGLRSGPADPASMASGVTPSDVTDLSYIPRGLYVGTGGNVAVVMRGSADGTPVTFANVPDGAFLPVRVSRVMSTGTTASNILAVW